VQEPRVHAILRADLKGLPDSYIMEKMDISPGILQRVRSSELYRERFTALQARADEQALDKVRDADDPVMEVLQEAAINAANKNVALLASATEKVAQASAWDILDRTGYPKATRAETTQKTVVTVDEATLRALGEVLEPPAISDDEPCDVETDGAEELEPPDGVEVEENGPPSV